MTSLPQVYLARHGETAWSLSGQHTGRTDLPLTARGEDNGRRLAQRLAGLTFSQIFSSPRQRALKTCEFAGLADRVEIDPELAEWDYGDYEGITTKDIRKSRPDWYLFRDGCPNGESVQAVGQRADRVLARLKKLSGNVIAFSHGHFLRVLAARWLGLPAGDARFFLLGTAALSIVGFEHSNPEEPAIALWNDDRHVKQQ